MTDDDVMFLASGMSFNLLLAAVPFILLLVSLSVWLFGSTAQGASAAAVDLLGTLLPARGGVDAQQLRELVHDIARLSQSATLYSAVGFLWFSTRLSSAMRSIFLRTFAVPAERGIVHGKLFDLGCALLAAGGITAYGVLSAYLLTSTSWGAAVLVHLGVREAVMGPVEYFAGRCLAFAMVALLCFAAYRLVPNRPIPARIAWVGSITTTVLFECARIVFGYYILTFSPQSIYTGTIATLVIVALWAYYASLIFVIGAVVAQAVLRSEAT